MANRRTTLSIITSTYRNQPELEHSKTMRQTVPRIRPNEILGKNNSDKYFLNDKLTCPSISTSGDCSCSQVQGLEAGQHNYINLQ